MGQARGMRQAKNGNVPEVWERKEGWGRLRIGTYTRNRTGRRDGTGKRSGTG
jgi:hypothetical protein